MVHRYAAGCLAAALALSGCGSSPPPPPPSSEATMTLPALREAYEACVWYFYKPLPALPPPTPELARQVAENAEGICSQQRADMRGAAARSGGNARSADAYVAEARASIIMRMTQRLLTDK